MPNAMFTFIRLLYEFRIFHSQYTHWLESTSLSILSDNWSQPFSIIAKNGLWKAKRKMMKVLDIWHFFFIQFHLYDVMNSLSECNHCKYRRNGKIISFSFDECKQARWVCFAVEDEVILTMYQMCWKQTGPTLLLWIKTHTHRRHRPNIKRKGKAFRAKCCWFFMARSRGRQSVCVCVWRCHQHNEYST